MKKAVKYLGIKKYYLQNIPSRSLKMHILKTINKIKFIIQVPITSQQFLLQHTKEAIKTMMCLIL